MNFVSKRILLRGNLFHSIAVNQVSTSRYYKFTTNTVIGGAGGTFLTRKQLPWKSDAPSISPCDEVI